MILYCLILAIVLHQASAILQVTENVQFFTINNWENIEHSLDAGSIRGYYSISEMNSLLSSYLTNFPAVIGAIVNIGNTRNGEAMYAIQVTYDPTIYQTPKSIVNLAQYTNSFSSRPAVLFTAMHEGSDPTTMQLAILFIKKMIFGFVNNDPAVTYLLNTRQIWVIPCVNRDTYYAISLNYENLNSFPAVLSVKNQFTDGNCNSPYNGVNLRYNYPSYNGASFTPTIECSNYYQGSTPLSEPEATNLNNFVTTVSITLAINLFGQTNSLFLPNSYLTSSNYEQSSLYHNSNDLSVYQQIYQNAFPTGQTFFGNFFGKYLNSYLGEISDYFYNRLNIYSLSAELGTASIGTSVYPFMSFTQNLEMMSYNFNLGMYSIYKIGPNLLLSTLYQLIEVCQQSHWPYIACKGTNYEVFSARYQFKNDGLTGAQNVVVDLTVPTTLAIVQVSLETSYSTIYFFTDSQLSPVNFNTITVSAGTMYQFLVPSSNPLSTMYISVSGLYTPTSSPGSLNLTASGYYSFNGGQTVTETVQSMGGVTGFQATLPPAAAGPNPHQPSNIIVIVYFVILGTTLLTIGFGKALGVVLKSSEANK